MTEYIATIGLETHVQLKTRTKKEKQRKFSKRDMELAITKKLGAKWAGSKSVLMDTALL